MRSRGRLNVQQQNKIVEDRIRGEAGYWRQHGVPQPLAVAGHERGIDWAKSIVIELDIDFPGMAPLLGYLLSQDERFIRFEIDTDEAHQVFKAVEWWEDVTGRQNLSLHNRGIGAGRGALAIKVLHEFNAPKNEDSAKTDYE